MMMTLINNTHVLAGNQQNCSPYENETDIHRQSACSTDRPIKDIVSSLNGRILIGVSNVGVYYWDINSGRIINSFIAHGNSIAGISSISENFKNNEIITASSNGFAKIWALNTNQFKRRYCPGRILLNAKFSPNGKLIGIFVATKGIIVYDRNSGKIITEINEKKYGMSGELSYNLEFTLDSMNIIFYGKSNIILWDIYRRKEYYKFTDNTETINSFDYSPDGKYLNFSTDKGRVGIWNFYDREYLGAIKVGKNIKSVKFSNDSKLMLYVTSAKIGILDLKGQTKSKITSQVEKFTNAIFTKDNTRIITVSSDDNQDSTNYPVGDVLKIWSVYDGHYIRKLQRIYQLKFRP